MLSYELRPPLLRFHRVNLLPVGRFRGHLKIGLPSWSPNTQHPKNRDPQTFFSRSIHMTEWASTVIITLPLVPDLHRWLVPSSLLLKFSIVSPSHREQSADIHSRKKKIFLRTHAID